MASTITIVFRGLFVFNKQTSRGRDYFEIGILDERPGHVPRIMTFRKGVREDTKLLEADINKPPVLWTLEVAQPVTQGITTRQTSTSQIDRLQNIPPDDDFRWIIDLEDNEFPYGNIDQQFTLKRTKLRHVVRIDNGEFYTRLKSLPLRRRQVNTTTVIDFGAVAGVIGCDIQVNSGNAKLIGADPSQPIFTFESNPDLLYEFSNSPPDTAGPGDHFDHYYDIFTRQPPAKFGFENPAAAGPSPPGPNPALCGKIYLSQFDGSLT